MTEKDDASSSVFNDLKTRSLVGIVFAAIAFLFLWIGGGVFSAFMAVITGLMLIEATRLTASECDLQELPRYCMIALGSTAVFILNFNGLWFTVLASLGLLSAAAINPKIIGKLTVAGYALIVLAAAAAIFLRGLDAGLPLLVWIILSVAAADIGGYMFGRKFQGPKLIPSISPKKTWSGFLGGLGLAVLVSIVFSFVSGAGIGQMILFGALVSIASVAGDLIESSAKRRFGVKDAGTILPGHGGLLDRLDGMSAVILLLGSLALMFDLGSTIAPRFAATGGL